MRSEAVFKSTCNSERICCHRQYFLQNDQMKIGDHFRIDHKIISSSRNYEYFVVIEFVLLQVLVETIVLDSIVKKSSVLNITMNFYKFVDHNRHCFPQ